MGVFSFWHGSELGFLELLSLRSFVANGHEVTLYSYNELQNLPVGVKNKNANEVLSADIVFTTKHHNNPQNFATFADYFRFARLAMEGGLWVDLDNICLKNFDSIPHNQYLGREDLHFIGTAVMKL